MVHQDRKCEELIVVHTGHVCVTVEIVSVKCTAPSDNATDSMPRCVYMYVCVCMICIYK